MGTKRPLEIVIALMASFASSAPAVAGNIYVDDSHTSGTFDGTSWAKSFQDLQHALNIAMANDVIHVAQGTYYPSVRTSASVARSESFSLIPSVIILGGYVGYNDPLPNTRDPSQYPTILSGDIGLPNVTTDNCYHVVTATGVSNTTILDGFIIEKGQADTSQSNLRGAGIQITGSNSSPQFHNCTIRDNYARRTTTPTSGHGAGVYASPTNINAAIVFENCDFMDNESGQFGGAAYVTNVASIRFTDCNFSNNAATNPSGTSATGGGAVFVAGNGDQRADFDNCHFENNSVAAGNGGGAYVVGLVLAMSKCSFVTNTANAGTLGFGQGGGVYLNRAQRTDIFECDFIGNQANQSSFFAGGGIAMLAQPFPQDIPHTGPVMLVNCRFLGNGTGVGGYGGGLIHDHVGDLVDMNGVDLVNCLFVDNSAFWGGAAYCFRDSGQRIVKFTNCTLADNHTQEGGSHGGIAMKVSTSVQLRNCVLWGNTDSTSGAGVTNSQQIGPIDASGPDIQYSDVAGVLYTGTGNINDDPMFLGPTTGPVTLRNYSLQPCSPASDAADYDAVVNASDPADLDGDSTTNEPLPRDLILAARVTDNSFRNNDGNGTFTYTDMGAYEIVVPECSLVGDVNGDSDVDGLDVGPFTVCVLAQSSTCPCGDLDMTGITDFNDIDCFVDLLLTGAPCGIVNCESGQRSFPDCNENGVNDKNDIGTGASPDCNENGIPDECEIDENSTAEGGPWYCESDCASDVNDNGIPDECEDDCNTNGVPDAWDISEATSDDVNTNGIPDECEPDCNTNGIPDAWDISETTSADCNTNGYPDECEDDCNTNGVPDDCDVDPTDPDGDERVSPDCNEDGYPDECNLSLPPPFGSSDCNTNGIPDECDIAACENDPACDDCNSNGIPDGCDIAAEISEDIDTNGIPDECEGESLMGGGESMMSSGDDGDTGETPVPPDEEAAWEAFYDWSITQCWGPNCEAGTDAQFAAMIAKLRELGLPTSAVGP